MALGNHKKVLGRVGDIICLDRGRDCTLALSVSPGSERTQLSWVKGKASDCDGNKAMSGKNTFGGVSNVRLRRWAVS